MTGDMKDEACKKKHFSVFQVNCFGSLWTNLIILISGFSTQLFSG